jgi:hypothetical protein
MVHLDRQRRTRRRRTAQRALLRHLEESGQTGFEIDADFYWDVPAERRHSPYDERKQLSMRQLPDDCSEVVQVMNGTSLHHLASGFAGERQPARLTSHGNCRAFRHGTGLAELPARDRRSALEQPR